MFIDPLPHGGQLVIILSRGDPEDADLCRDLLEVAPQVRDEVLYLMLFSRKRLSIKNESEQGAMPKVGKTVPLLLREVCTVRHGSQRGLERSLVLLEDVVVCHLFEVT